MLPRVYVDIDDTHIATVPVLLGGIVAQKGTSADAVAAGICPMQSLAAVARFFRREET
jgi:hypothetical protein